MSTSSQPVACWWCKKSGLIHVPPNSPGDAGFILRLIDAYCVYPTLAAKIDAQGPLVGKLSGTYMPCPRCDQPGANADSPCSGPGVAGHHPGPDATLHHLVEQYLNDQAFKKQIDGK